MSDTYGDDDMPDDPFGGNDFDRAAADTLLERWQAFEDKARTLGLYLDGPGAQIAMVPTPPHGAPELALAVHFQVGRVAFSDRVQNPPKEEVDDEVRKMDIALKDDLFLDERARIEQAMKEGKDPFEILLGDEDEISDDTPNDR